MAMPTTGRKLTAVVDLQNLQKQFMEVLGIDPNPVDESDILTSVTIQDASQGLVLEAAEILNELTILSKSWKHKENSAIHVDMTLELVDVLFYVLELSVLLGMTADDLASLYVTKMKRNLGRIILADHASEQQKIQASELLDELKD